MVAEQILELIRREPFEPFRVYVSDGASYDVMHPELMAVSKRIVVIIYYPNGYRNGDSERWVYCDPVHITRIEPVPKSKRSDHRKK